MDTSALLKLIITEAESAELRGYLASRGAEPLITSEIGAVELVRGSSRIDPAATSRARSLVSGIEVASLTPGISALARELLPAALRTLDAVHVATAMDLHAGVVVTYDRRMIDACRANGLDAVAPGAD